MKRRIDVDGFHVDDIPIAAKGLTIIEAPCPVGLFRAKWDGKKWVEGGSAPVSKEDQMQAEIDQLKAKLAEIEQTPTVKTELITVKEPILKG